MSNKSKGILGVIVLVGLISAFFAVTWVQAGRVSQVELTESEARISKVSVSGSGEIRAVPDIAIIRLGVETQAETAQTALTKNNEQMQSLMDSLRDSGIPAENIQTQTIRLTPRYNIDEEDGTRRLIGYSASNIVVIETTDLERLGIILDSAVSAGATTIDNIRFEISDIENLAEDARRAAVENAQDKAQQLASLTDVTLGTVLDIQEFSDLPGPVQQQVEFQAETMAVPIQPGTQTLHINVQITWQLEK